MSLLSLEKLETYLVSKNLLMTKLYTLKNYCIMVEVIHPNTSSIFMLYIPMTYRIEISTGWIKTKIYEIKSISPDMLLDNSQNTTEPQTLLDKAILDKNAYTYPDELKINNILSRYKTFVKNIPYKLFLIIGDKLGLVTTNNTIELYSIKNYDKNVLFIGLVDIEQLYRKETSYIDLMTVKQKIYEILDSNFDIYSTNKNIFMGCIHTDILLAQSEKKKTYISHLTSFKNILNDLCKTEATLSNTISQIHTKPDFLYTYDISKSQELLKNTKIMERLIEPKSRLLKCIFDLQIKIDSIYINIDNLCYEIDVMNKKINTLIRSLTNN